METNKLGVWITIIAVIIWLLAIVWRPFGDPKITWHIFNLIVLIIGIIMTFIGKKDE